MGAEVEEREAVRGARAPSARCAYLARHAHGHGNREPDDGGGACRGITVHQQRCARAPRVRPARCLIGMGAHITGVGTELIVIEGSGGAARHDHKITADYNRGRHVHDRGRRRRTGECRRRAHAPERSALVSANSARRGATSGGANHVRVTCSHLRGVDMTRGRTRICHRHAAAVLPRCRARP